MTASARQSVMHVWVWASSVHLRVKDGLHGDALSSIGNKKRTAVGFWRPFAPAFDVQKAKLDAKRTQALPSGAGMSHPHLCMQLCMFGTHM